MKYFETPHEKKAFTITAVLMAILLFLIITFGLTYLDPPPENGIAINFGNTDNGMGNDNSPELTQSAPQVAAAASAAPTKEDVATQEMEDAPVIKETPKVKPQTIPTENTKPKANPTPTPSKSTTDALNSLLNGPKQDGTTNQSDGTGNQPGNQGALDGSIYSNAYFGSGAGSGKWGLNGRGSPKPGGVIKPNCDDKGIPPSSFEGRMIIEIKVDRSGNVIDAKYVSKNSTITKVDCLIDAAYKTAKLYTWDRDMNAPSVQIGYIVFDFKNGVIVN